MNGSNPGWAPEQRRHVRDGDFRVGRNCVCNTWGDRPPAANITATLRKYGRSFLKAALDGWIRCGSAAA